MTLQTAAPIAHLKTTCPTARDLFSLVSDGLMTAELAYQQASVRTLGYKS